MVAQYHEWTGAPIFDTVQSALEDANFHTLNERFGELIGRKQEEDETNAEAVRVALAGAE